MFESILISFALIFTFNIMCYQMVKTERAFNIFRWLCLGDVYIFAIAALILALGEAQPYLTIKIFILIAYSLFFFYIWLDAFVNHQFSMEIRLKEILFFFKHSKELVNENVGRVNLKLNEKFWFYLLPVLVPVYNVHFLLHANVSTSLSYYVISLFVTLYLFSTSRSKLSIWALPLWLLAYFLVYYIFSLLLIPFWQKDPAIISSAFIIVMITGLLAFYFFSKKKHNFFTTKTLIKALLFADNLKPNKKIKVSTQHQKYINAELHAQEKSEHFGLLKDKNVIIVSVESMAQCYTSTLNLPFLTTLKENAITSSKHFAISPVTSSFMDHLYYANYTKFQKQSLLQPFLDKGYETINLISWNKNDYNHGSLCKKIGFQHVIDSCDLKRVGTRLTDYMFLDSFELLEPILTNKKFFLHFHNIGTHSPYNVIDKKKFNRHGTSRFSNYQNALEEYDYILQTFFEKLATMVDLDNTVIVYVGDHGQSFGEHGYKAHSTSTFAQQIEVPFVIQTNHGLSHTVQASSHFTILPTLLDLLGIDYFSKHAGVTSFMQDNQLPPMLYSGVVTGNAPTNLSMLLDNKKIMLDRSGKNNYRLSLNDEILKQLSPHEINYFKVLAYHMLQTRGLLDLDY
jgi:glucan phosphoethanolaminetransferase (alkaline phosphatase superfamily)